MPAITNKGRELAARIYRRTGVLVDAETCSLIARHAVTLERLAVRICCEEMSPEEERRTNARDDRLAARVESLAASLAPGFSATVQGDPRGVIVMIHGPKDAPDQREGVGV